MRRQREDNQRIRATAAKLIDAEITDFDDLWYPEKRTPVDSWLRERGWDVLSLSFPELMARYHRTIPQGAEDAMPPTQFVSARAKG